MDTTAPAPFISAPASAKSVLDRIANTVYPFDQEFGRFTSFSDEGLTYANKKAKKWSKRKIIKNQSTFDKKSHFRSSVYSAKEIEIAAVYLYIIRTARVQNSAEYQDRQANGATESLEPCWVATVGDAPDTYGRRRIGICGAKVFLYLIVAAIHWKFTPGLEWSHLCGNAACVRPTHLHEEGRKANMARISCPGWIYLPNTDELLCCCNCDPKCKKFRVATPIPAIEY